MPLVSATIRYGISTGEIPNDDAVGVLALRIRYRSGSGRVLAALTEVRVPEAVFSPPSADGTVSEGVLIQFDSASPGNDSTKVFRTFDATIDSSSPAFKHLVNNSLNVYYIAITLIGPQVVAGVPPAVSAVEIIQAQAF